MTRGSYRNLHQRKVLEEFPDWIWCLANCGHGQRHAAGHEQPLMVCTACHRRSCIRHGILWHEGQTCEAFDAARITAEHREEERQTERITRPCANCRARIQRTEGW